MLPYTPAAVDSALFNTTLFRELCAAVVDQAGAARRVCTPDGAFSIFCVGGRIVGDAGNGTSALTVPARSVVSCDLRTGGCRDSAAGDCAMPLADIILIAVCVFILAGALGFVLGVAAAELRNLYRRCRRHHGGGRTVRATRDNEQMEVVVDDAVTPPPADGTKGEGGDGASVSSSSSTTASTLNSMTGSISDSIV